MEGPLRSKQKKNEGFLWFIRSYVLAHSASATYSLMFSCNQVVLTPSQVNMVSNEQSHVTKLIFHS